MAIPETWTYLLLSCALKLNDDDDDIGGLVVNGMFLIYLLDSTNVYGSSSEVSEGI